MKTRFREVIREFTFKNATIRLHKSVDSMPNLFGKKSDVRYHIDVYDSEDIPTNKGVFNFKRKAEAIKAFNKIKREGKI